MQIKLYGVRGSLPSPVTNDEYRQKIRKILDYAARENLKSSQINSFMKMLPDDLKNIYGGNTTCVNVTDAEHNIILDAGTGIRVLGDELMQGPAGKGEAELHLFFTHTHWDHIQGLPFFKPVYIPGNRIHIYSPLPDIEERLLYQQNEKFFPAPFMTSGAEKIYHVLEKGETVEFDNSVKVDFHPLKHPGGSYAYRFRKNSRTFIFATDAEFTGNYLEQIDNDDSFFHDADLLVLDAQYTLDESFQKFDWGHTSFTMAINVSLKWNVKNLVMTHHEPAYSDLKLHENLDMARFHRSELQKKNPHIYLAREGMKFSL